ncbi:MAG: hypothetical protein AB200_02360 [Parcubacteria bacterium C7867-005]|nr:MAG: hypothetical protein AB200_02360 [Parcubacteria bacterium C7867-005]
MKFFSFILITSLFFIPSISFALGLPFGGRVAVTVPCTCSLPGTLHISFAPLYLSAVPIVGSVVYSPTTILYQYFAIGVPTTWELGEYLPGVQECFIYVGVACVPLPSVGVMTRVGTSL